MKNVFARRMCATQNRDSIESCIELLDGFQIPPHQSVFRWVLELLAEEGLLKGKTGDGDPNP